MPENIKLNISAGQKKKGDKIKPKPTLSLQQAIDVIKSKEYPEEIEKELIKNIKRQPSNTFEKFLKNIGKQIEKGRDGKNKK